GHTDSTGTDEINDRLSDERAASVTQYLTAQGVAAHRITSEGYGSEQPIADNETAEGRQANRRVEVAIYANDRMVKAAERGELESVTADAARSRSGGNLVPLERDGPVDSHSQ